MMRGFLSLFVAVLGTIALRAQVPGIADPLLKNSDAVARLVSIDYVYDSPTAASARIVERTTVLNARAAEKGCFVCHVSPKVQLKSFSGTLSDAQGRTIRKFKRSDLKYTEYRSGSISDAAYYYLEVYAPSYPCTVHYEYEIAYRNGILVFPSFVPVTATGTSLEKGVYTLSVPGGLAFGYKSRLIGEPEKSTERGRDIYRWTLENVPAVKGERASPPLEELVPQVLAVPYSFQYENTQGSMRDWASYGAWQCDLLEGRDRLPEALRAEVHRLTDTLPTAREKVRALYRYLGSTTRYVSIQLGIGGLQPATAEEVYKTKFGDCKALTNYLRAMLAECGIRSDYVIIHSKRRRMYPDFASPNQADHAILRVPLADETLWLECTDPEIPFGYIHANIAGHDAIVFRDGTGESVTLPQYADSLNRMVQQVEITLRDDGTAEGIVTERYEGVQYERMMRFRKLPENKRADFLLSDLKVPLVQVSRITCDERKEALPSIEIGYRLSSSKYVNITGNRCFVPLTPFSDKSQFRDKERQNDIYLAAGYTDSTVVKMHIPANMHIESLPRPCSVTRPFGSYSLDVSVEEGLITVEQRTTMHAGTYPRAMFEQYRDFISGRARTFNADIVLKKE